MTAVSSVSSCMHWIRGCIIILLLTILDQGSKSLVLAQLKDQPDISLIPGALQLRYLENRGMAFGLFEGKIPVFVILCLLFFGVFIYVYARIPGHTGQNSFAEGHLEGVFPAPIQVRLSVL